MSSKNTIIAVVVVIILLIVGFVGAKAVRNVANEPPVVQTVTTPTENPSPAASASANITTAATFTLSSTAVTPASVTIKIGESVIWVNSSGSDVQIASLPHPAHTDYPPLNIGMVASSSQKSLTFPTAGTYKWHNHLNPAVHGTITVQ